MDRRVESVVLAFLAYVAATRVFYQIEVGRVRSDIQITSALRGRHSAADGRADVQCDAVGSDCLAPMH